MARQRVGGAVSRALTVDNTVLQPNKLGEHLLLPNSVEALLLQLGQALLIGQDNKLLELQVCPPLLNSEQNGHVLFLVS